MLIHGIQNTVADIVILHTGTKLNLLIATEKGITTSLGGGKNRGEYNAHYTIYRLKFNLSAGKFLRAHDCRALCIC